ncbi:MAG TPA: hypothetical protein QF353_00795 [Gammaproteobacteria bacterium]|nr:hypothetical protein [Gammaproteobacteria bacterium]
MSHIEEVIQKAIDSSDLEMILFLFITEVKFTKAMDQLECSNPAFTYSDFTKQLNSNIDLRNRDHLPPFYDKDTSAYTHNAHNNRIFSEDVGLDLKSIERIDPNVGIAMLKKFAPNNATIRHIALFLVGEEEDQKRAASEDNQYFHTLKNLLALINQSFCDEYKRHKTMTASIRQQIIQYMISGGVEVCNIFEKITMLDLLKEIDTKTDQINELLATDGFDIESKTTIRIKLTNINTNIQGISKNDLEMMETNRNNIKSIYAETQIAYEQGQLDEKCKKLITMINTSTVQCAFRDQLFDDEGNNLTKSLTQTTKSLQQAIAINNPESGDEEMKVDVEEKYTELKNKFTTWQEAESKYIPPLMTRFFNYFSTPPETTNQQQPYRSPVKLEQKEGHKPLLSQREFKLYSTSIGLYKFEENGQIIAGRDQVLQLKESSAKIVQDKLQNLSELSKNTESIENQLSEKIKEAKDYADLESANEKIKQLNTEIVSIEKKQKVRLNEGQDKVRATIKSVWSKHDDNNKSCDAILMIQNDTTQRLETLGKTMQGDINPQQLLHGLVGTAKQDSAKENANTAASGDVSEYIALASKFKEGESSLYTYFTLRSYIDDEFHKWLKTHSTGKEEAQGILPEQLNIIEEAIKTLVDTVSLINKFYKDQPPFNPFNLFGGMWSSQLSFTIAAARESIGVKQQALSLLRSENMGNGNQDNARSLQTPAVALLNSENMENSNQDNLIIYFFTALSNFKNHASSNVEILFTCKGHKLSFNQKDLCDKINKNIDKITELFRISSADNPQVKKEETEKQMIVSLKDHIAKSQTENIAIITHTSCSVGQDQRAALTSIGQLKRTLEPIIKTRRTKTLASKYQIGLQAPDQSKELTNENIKELKELIELVPKAEGAVLRLINSDKTRFKSVNTAAKIVDDYTNEQNENFAPN